jgi:hypothetical protein
MSTGPLGYDGQAINTALGSIKRDADLARRFPRLAVALAELGEHLRRIEREIDWDSTGVSRIEDDAEFEMLALGRLTVAASGGPELAKGSCRVTVTVVSPNKMLGEVLQQVRSYNPRNPGKVMFLTGIEAPEMTSDELMKVLASISPPVNVVVRKGTVVGVETAK